MGEKSKRKDAERGERYAESKGRGGGAAECYLRVRKHPIYTSFFKCWLVKPIQFDSVRFNRFQTLETEPNRNCFVIF